MEFWGGNASKFGNFQELGAPDSPGEGDTPVLSPCPHLDQEVAVLVLCHHHGRVVQLLLEVDVAVGPLLGVAVCPLPGVALGPLGGEAHS